MSILSGSRGAESGLRRGEILAAIAEVTAIFSIFIVAFTGRSAFGDTARQILIVLSLLAGALGTIAGLVVLIRGVQQQAARIPRLALGGFMSFIGIYTIVHVL